MTVVLVGVPFRIFVVEEIAHVAVQPDHASLLRFLVEVQAELRLLMWMRYKCCSTSDVAFILMKIIKKSLKHLEFIVWSSVWRLL